MIGYVGHALMYRYVLSIRKPQFRTMLKEKLCNRAMILNKIIKPFGINRHVAKRATWTSPYTLKENMAL